MKALIFIVILIVAGRTGLSLLAPSRNAPGVPGQAGTAPRAPGVGRGATAGAKAQPPVSLADRRRMTETERLRWLERNGEVPEDAEMPLDWNLAEQTSWWGKPLDRKVFWKDRVVWLDETADSAARRRGRGFPPIPYDDPTLPVFRDDENDFLNTEGVPEGPNIRLHWTSKERAFWTRFSRTHPRPPEVLARKQSQLAAETLWLQHASQGSNPLSRLHTMAVEVPDPRALKAGYPPEMLTEDALYWSYVLDRRREYQSLRDRFGLQSVIVTNFFSGLAIDAKIVTDPPSKDPVQAANAWKITYLQRLRKEKTNESSVTAYLQAWDLSADAVFGGAKGP